MILMAKRRPSGDGMVRRREDGRWEGRIVVGHKKNGDSIFRYVYAPTQKELSAKLRQHIDSYQGADLTEQSRMTLSEWLDKWLENMADTLRPNTLRNYCSYIENHIRPGLGNKQLSRITPKDVQRFYEKLSDSTTCVTLMSSPRQKFGKYPKPQITQPLTERLRGALDICFEQNRGNRRRSYGESNQDMISRK